MARPKNKIKLQILLNPKTRDDERIANYLKNFKARGEKIYEVKKCILAAIDKFGKEFFCDENSFKKKEVPVAVAISSYQEKKEEADSQPEQEKEFTEKSADHGQFCPGFETF